MFRITIEEVRKITGTQQDEVVQSHNWQTEKNINIAEIIALINSKRNRTKDKKKAPKQDKLL